MQLAKRNTKPFPKLAFFFWIFASRQESSSEGDHHSNNLQHSLHQQVRVLPADQEFIAN
jgi:hypothetical protein